MTDIESAQHAPSRCTLGEGPVWHDGALWFVDIEQHKLHTLRDGQITSHDAGERIGFAVPTARGDWIVGLQSGLARWQPGQGSPAIFSSPEPPPANNRFNDAKTDPAGRLFAGTMHMPCELPAAALYRVDRDLSVTPVRTGVTISNGLAWDAARNAMYYTDTVTQRITRYDWDPDTSAISNPATLIEPDPSLGNPDGMAIDTAGNLYVAMWAGASVLVIDPSTASITARIAVDAPHVTSCAFGQSAGSPDALDTLYITTARIGLTPPQLEAHPHSGDIFAARIPGAAGHPPTLFAGE